MRSLFARAWKSGLWIKPLSIGLLLAVWYAAALLPTRPIFPPPHVVIGYLLDDITHATIWSNLFITLFRIMCSFFLAMLVAVPAGIALGFSSIARRLFGSWVTIGLMTPSLVFIILSYTAIGLNEYAAIIASAVAVVWVLTINIWESAKAIDLKLVQMARVFNVRRPAVIRQVVLPQLAPPLMASARFGLGLVWKMVLFVELIGRSNGIGYQIEYYYQLFNLGRVLEYTIFFVSVMLLIEIAVLGNIEKRLFRWRPAPRFA